MCQIAGAVLATLGIYRAVPLIHGSQGCVNYVKHLMSRHFGEPVEIATTAIHEKSAVFGGRDNLVSAIENIRLRKDPDLIVVMSTCLTETIGENIHIATEFDGVVAVNTPSYAGTHTTGYDRALKAIISSLVGNGGKGGKEEKRERTENVNIITGIVNPGDVREIKHVCESLEAEYTLLTDLTSLDRPLRLPREKFPACSTGVEDIRNSANSKATISFGTEGISGAKYLENFGAVSYSLKFPIGIENTDHFVATLAGIAGTEIPDSVWDDRDYAVDAMVDANSVLRNRKVAIFGDPDKVIAMTDFAFEIGMRVTAVLSPIKKRYFVPEIEKKANENDVNITVFENGDLYTLHRFIKSNPVDMLIGDYRGRYIAREERIPLLRTGFPVADRFGYHRKPMLGYNGALRLVEEAANLLVGDCYG